MTVAAKLVVAALFALNQYLPINSDPNKPQRIIHDVRGSFDPVTKTYTPMSDAETKALVFLAANHSCRYMKEVFAVSLNDIANQDDEKVASMLNMLNSPEELRKQLSGASQTQYNDRLEKAGIDIKNIAELFISICNDNFQPHHFAPFGQEMVDFINQEIKVLDDVQLKSLGKFRLFGSSPVYDNNGVKVSTIDTDGRSWISFKDIPENLLNALLATEDLSFMQHSGIDAKGLARIAGFVGLQKTNIAGGSTLTMQLLKNLYFGGYEHPEDSIFTNSDMATSLRKAREIYWAKPYETIHGGPVQGKEHVLEQYLNLMTFGPGIQGIAQAASTFFGKNVKELTVGESAFIASLLKNPFRYSNPLYFNSEKRSTSGRITGYILPRMHAAGLIDDQQLNDAMAYHLPDEFYEKAKRNMLSEAFIHITNQARSWIRKAQVFAGYPTEVEVKTTINSELQTVVFNSVKKILDRHDSNRNDLSRVGPAIDSTGKIAKPVFNDLSQVSLDNLYGSIEDLNALTDFIFMTSLFMGEQEQGDRFINIGASYNQWPEELKDQLNSKLSNHFKFIGQVALIRLAANENCKPDFSDLDFNETVELKEKYIPESLDCIEIVNRPEDIIESDYLFNFTRFAEAARIEFISNTLNRVSTGRSRAEHIAAMYDGFSQSGDNYLVFADGSRPKLKNKHNQRLKSIMSRSKDPLLVGNVVWLKPVESQTKKSTAPTTVLIPRMRPWKNEEELAQLKQQQAANITDELLPEIFIDGVYDLRSPEKIRADQIRIANQKLADKYDSFELTPPMLQAAVLIMNSHTGEVLANFGGYNPAVSAFDRSRLSIRQPGSTVKPWIYYLALQKGLRPHQTIKNSGVSFNLGTGFGTWVPSGGSVGGQIGFYQGLIYSQNAATAGLLQNEDWNGGNWRSNLQELCQFFKDIKLYDKIGCYPAITLGAQEVSIKDLVRTYTFFSNGREVVEPRFIKNVKDGFGETFFESEKQSYTFTQNDDTALFHLRSMMIKVNNRGTASRLNRFLKSFGGKNNEYPFQHCFVKFGGLDEQSCFGGKTGTTNDSKDTWYVGYSNKYVIGVWVGYDQPETIAAPATGADTAFPIFEQILFSGYNLLPEIQPLLGNHQVPEDMKIVNVLNVPGERACVINSPGNLADHQYTTLFVDKNTNDFEGCQRCECRRKKYAEGDYDYDLFVAVFMISQGVWWLVKYP